MAKTPYPRTDRELLRRIERSAGQRAGYKQLVRELGLGGGRERRLLLDQLSRMTARGEIVKTDAEQWALPGAAPEKTARVASIPLTRDGAAREWATRSDSSRATRDRLIAGKLDLHRDGYGFVRPNGSPPRENDLSTPAAKSTAGMQGEEGRVSRDTPRRDGRG